MDESPFSRAGTACGRTDTSGKNEIQVGTRRRDSGAPGADLECSFAKLDEAGRLAQSGELVVTTCDQPDAPRYGTNNAEPAGLLFPNPVTVLSP